MAEVLARQMFGRTIYFASAGVRAGELDPFAVAAMEEMGLDLSRHRPQAIEDLEDASFDVIVSLSPEAHHRALEFTRSLAVDVMYWPTHDPTHIEGSREQRLAAYEHVRDGLAQRIRDWLGWQPISAG
jgi:protein-tyrosine-phosphatase